MFETTFCCWYIAPEFLLLTQYLREGLFLETTGVILVLGSTGELVYFTLEIDAVRFLWIYPFVAIKKCREYSIVA